MARSPRAPKTTPTTEAPEALATPAPDAPPQPGTGRVRYLTLPIAELELDRYNPREHTDESRGNLSSSVGRFGLVQPVVVSERDGVRRVVGGHERIAVVVAAGGTEIDVALGSWSEVEERALNVTLNNKANQGEFSDDLASYLDSIARGLNAGDFLDLGLDELFADQPKKKGGRKRKQSDGLTYKVVVDCTDEGHQAEVMAQLEAEGLTVSPLIS